jgi:broad specificity phosphatase PhoE
MARLILIRHGATDWNREGRYQGQADTPLNEEGVEQARRLIDRLAADGVSRVVSSDLQRARQTALILADGLQLELPGTDARLREIDLGRWEGRLATEIAREDTQAWAARMNDPVNVAAPGGETTLQVAHRVWACLDEIAREAGVAPIAVVSHGLAIATALCRARGIPLAQAGGLEPGNAEPIRVDWADQPANRREQR